jgi:hypothetical protein
MRHASGRYNRLHPLPPSVPPNLYQHSTHDHWPPHIPCPSWPTAAPAPAAAARRPIAGAPWGHWYGGRRKADALQCKTLHDVQGAPASPPAQNQDEAGSGRNGGHTSSSHTSAGCTERRARSRSRGQSRYCRFMIQLTQLPCLHTDTHSYVDTLPASSQGCVAQVGDAEAARASSLVPWRSRCQAPACMRLQNVGTAAIDNAGQPWAPTRR